MNPPTTRDIKQGSLLWIAIALFSYGMPSIETRIGVACVVISIVLILIREYVKPNN
ncbi:MAG: hypothetical protein KAJ03_07525 [Gammaproteobacteria bacterium]|nr:hypothetical protein [Gammaproteobacteria bacterium]